MTRLVAVAAALLLALVLGVSSPVAPARAEPPVAAPAQRVLPEAPKKTPKPKPKPKPTPTATPTVTPASTPTTRPRSAAEEEGDRWVLIAMIAGGGLLGCVALFFGIGALLRRKPRSRG